LFGKTIASAYRPLGPALARQPEQQRFTGHPFRTSPLLLAAPSSISPRRVSRLAEATGQKGTMAKEICISSTPHETRLAILEDDQLAEIYYERENEYTLAGSIYNGRVTRVLPGMQSAFVDVGLERDAFLYVTDFMELEDQEETDELEKAAISGGNQPPREVRHSSAPESTGERGGLKTNQKADQRPEQKPESRPAQDRPAPEKPAKDRRLTVEAQPESEAVSLPASGSLSFSEQPENGDEESGDPGAKRWRGRRRRRGGRGATASREGQSESRGSSETYVEEITETEPEVAPDIHAAEGVSGERSSSQPWSAPASHSERAPAPVPFVLPGESLTKYGGAPAESLATEKAAQSAAKPVKPASSFKPATLIESALAWDGSGLLPGESLSRHRNRENPPEENLPEADVEAEPQVEAALAPDVVEEQEFLSETAEADPEAIVPDALPEQDQKLIESEVVSKWTQASLAEAEPLEEDELEETSETASVAAPLAETGPEEPEAAELQPDASASHMVDPLPPTGFRLFGLGGKKKKDEENVVKPAPVSSYSPGSGLIVEETIEEEEFDAPRHYPRAKGGDHDSDDLEEETLPTNMRTGDLGEMLQEAHLDHRIQLNFDEKNEDEDDDEEGQPAAGGAARGAAPQRHDRMALGRRGRNGSAAPASQQSSRGRGPSRRSAQLSDLPIISDLLKPGQEILVQIAKEPIAKKGARITSHIALPGRFLVFMPTVSHIGVSRKIESDTERQRLKRILTHERGEASGGFIVRTAADGASEEELRTDLRMLLNLWAEIKKRSDESKSPALIYHDLGLIERILRDQVSSNFASIWVDSQDDYERIVRFLNRFSPSLVRRVKLYTKETPLFEHFGIQDEISKALNSKVWLKSGGSIVINQTEALVAIDINTGKYVGKSSRLEDTIVKTNLDAVPEIVRQIRLRDLGGIIVIDFIDMDDRKNRYKVMAALEEALKSDRAPTKVLQFNDFGLVAITRKRVKQSLERTLSVPCPTCQATGMVKSPTTVCNEIYTELRKMKKHFEGADVLLRVNPETVKVLKSNDASWLTEFEELIGRNILVKSDATLHPEQFDIQG
jgi:ribonuclease G